MSQLKENCDACGGRGRENNLLGLACIVCGGSGLVVRGVFEANEPSLLDEASRDLESAYALIDALQRTQSLTNDQLNAAVSALRRLLELDAMAPFLSPDIEVLVRTALERAS